MTDDSPTFVIEILPAGVLPPLRDPPVVPMVAA